MAEIDCSQVPLRVGVFVAVWRLYRQEDAVSSEPSGVDPELIVELNDATNKVLAKLRTQAVIDHVTVVRLSQQIVAYHSDGAYIEKMWETVLALADVVEREGERELSARLRSIAARR